MHPLEYCKLPTHTMTLRLGSSIWSTWKDGAGAAVVQAVGRTTGRSLNHLPQGHLEGLVHMAFSKPFPSVSLRGHATVREAKMGDILGDPPKQKVGVLLVSVQPTKRGYEASNKDTPILFCSDQDFIWSALRYSLPYLEIPPIKAPSTPSPLTNSQPH